MAMSILPRNLSGSAGVAQGINESISSTLDMLIKNKMQQQNQQQAMQVKEQQRQQQASRVSTGLQGLLGISEEDANEISMLPAAQQQMFVKQLLGSEEEEQQQPQEGVLDRISEQFGQDISGEEGADYSELTGKIQEMVSGLSPEDKQALKAEISKASTPRRKIRKRLRKKLPTAADKRAAAKMESKGLTGDPKTDKQMNRIMASKSPAKMSRKIKEYLSQRKKLPPNLKKQIKKLGFTGEDIKAIMSGSKLTPNLAEYFIKLSSGDPDKAKVIARKFGFKVPYDEFEESEVSEFVDQYRE